MGHYILCLFTVLLITVEPTTIQVDDSKEEVLASVQMDDGNISSMEALDMVKEKYAGNFEKICDETEEYYYKLPDYQYYLVMEDYDDTENYYLIHLYEFVVDELDTGIGHTYTYGWYKVYWDTGYILEYGY